MAASTTSNMRNRPNRFAVRRGALPPSAQVQHFSPAQWEKFVEAACLLRKEAGNPSYASVKRLGGSGDGGRDIEARYVPTLEADSWDLYQAKHYASGLTPSETFPEFAKFFLQLRKETYPVPRTYYLCAPMGVGNDLHDLLANPTALRARFLDDWKNERTGMKGRANELSVELEKLIQSFDFGRIVELPLRALLELHAADRAAHFELFGIEAERGDNPLAPLVPAVNEHAYVEELIRVYQEHSQSAMSLDQVMQTAPFDEHFQDQRSLFYCAEGLRIFSRDLYGEEEFDELLSMVLVGIRPRVNNLKHRTGMERLEAGLSEVSTLRIDDSVLAPRLRPGDLPGTCHHLANQGKLRWVR